MHMNIIKSEKMGHSQDISTCFIGRCVDYRCIDIGYRESEFQAGFKKAPRTHYDVCHCISPVHLFSIVTILGNAPKTARQQVLQDLSWLLAASSKSNFFSVYHHHWTPYY